MTALPSQSPLADLPRAKSRVERPEPQPVTPLEGIDGNGPALRAVLAEKGKKATEAGAVLRGRGEQVRKEAGPVGLQPAEEARLRHADQEIETSLVEFLQQLDAARQEIDRLEENARFSKSLAGKLDNTQEARERRRESTPALLEKARKAYADLLRASRSTEAGRKARRIHEARVKFAQLEATLKGGHITDAQAEQLLKKKTDSGRALSRHDAVRAEFLDARAEYVQLRAEIIGAHVAGFLHEQGALADARALEVARARRGDALEAHVRTPHTTTALEQVAGTVETGCVAVYTLWRTFREASVSKFLGKGDSRPLRVAIQDEMVGAAPLHAGGEAGAVRIPRRVGDVVAALRSSDALPTSAEEYAQMPRADIEALHQEAYARAIVNGKKPEEVPGYAQLKVALARHNKDRAALLVDTVEGKEGAARYNALLHGVKDIVVSTDAVWEAAQSQPHTARRFPSVAAAMVGVALAFGSAPEFAHAQDARPAAEAEAEPKRDVTITVEDIRFVYESGASESEVTRLLYAAIVDSLPESGDYHTVGFANTTIWLDVHAENITVHYPGGAPVSLGTIDEPDLDAYADLSTEIGKMFRRYSDVTLTPEPEESADDTLVADSSASTEMPSGLSWAERLAWVKAHEGDAAPKTAFQQRFEAEKTRAESGIEPPKTEFQKRLEANRAAAEAGIEPPKTPFQQRFEAAKAAAGATAPSETARAVSPDAPTEVVWHRVDHATPTGLFAKEERKAARAVGKKSVAEVVRTIDDAVTFDLDVRSPRERAEAQGEKAGSRVEHYKRAEAADAVWQEPATLTPERKADAHVEILDGTLHLPNGMEVHFYSGRGTTGHLDVTVARAMPPDTALKAVLGADYKSVISGLVSKYRQESVDRNKAILEIEFHAVRLAQLLEVRDYMVAVGLSDTKEFRYLRSEIESVAEKVGKYGHVVYDDPEYGQPSKEQKSDYFIEWGTPRLRVVPEPLPGKEE
ncbi:MAG: hypothetical protein KIH62_003945 [Candidatus Kerfeldbacteria bacterium]|nr:hypothetical protein [Candidatus Kerfeldbacteria bacterium]